MNWLTFDLALGTTATAAALIREYETPTAVRYLGTDYLVSIGKLNAAQAERLNNPDTRKAREIMALCREFNWQILTPDHPSYPIRLLLLSDFPTVLYANGNIELCQRLAMNAIVGTRRASERALDYAYRLASFFSENGMIPVSGCALGIDSAVHEGALAAASPTIAVLGNGFGYNYLPQQVFLRRRIQKYGLLLTETPPFTGPHAYSFQRRNRLIAGLSYTVTVVESAAKGGSLITADYARKQKKRLFVPARDTLSSPGCEDLLKKGAEELKDIADAVHLFHDQTLREPDVPLSSPQPLPPCLRPASLTNEAWAALNEALPVETADLFWQLPGQEGKAPLQFLPSKDDGSRETRQKEASETPVPGQPAVNDAPAAAPQTSAGKKEKSPQRRKPSVLPKTKAAKKPAQAAAVPQADLSDLPADAHRLYDALETEPVLLDELAGSLGFSGAVLMSAVSILELRGLIRTYPGNLVSRV